MRWKAWNFLNPNRRDSKETYGFKTNNNPPPIAELKDFESRVINLIENIEFKDSSGRKSAFQEQMEDYIKKI